MKTLKRFLSAVLCMTLIVGSLSLSAITASSDTTGIPEDAYEFNGHYYYVYKDACFTWDSAKAYCEGLGGHLVTITSAEENSFIASLITGSTMIGLSDAAIEGSWGWVTEESLSYTNWSRNEPNNQNNEDYALMLVGGTWNDGHLEREKWPFICEWEANEDNKTYNSLEQYMADVILSNGYQGCLNNYNGNTPQNFCYNYLMNPKQVSLSRVYVDLLYQNKEFQDSVLGWEIATFSPSDVMYQNALDEVGYYEAVIMSALDCSVKYSLIPDAVKETAKASTGITDGVYKVLQEFADMDYEKLSNQPWSLFDADAQHKAIQEASKKCTSLKMRSMSVSEFSDLLKTVGTVKEFCERTAQFDQVAKLDESVSTVLDYLYQACPDSNPAMKVAIEEVRTVCKSGLDKFAVDVFNGTIAISKMSADQLVDTAWNGYVIAQLGASVGTGVLIGQLIGESLSNFLFSTDNNIEQYYAMRALVQFENVMVDATARIAAQYKSDDSVNNAITFLTAIKMLIGTYGTSCDYAEDYTRIVKTEGLINDLKSLFGFGNKQEYEEFKSICQSMKGSLSTFEMCLTDVDFAYASALQIDDKDLYQTYISSGIGENDAFWKSKVITVACPTDVDIYQGDVKVAQTVNNELVGIVPGVAVYIDNDVKHIVLPAEGDYSVQITGTDTGTMDYVVDEYNSGRYNRGVAFENVPLTANCTYDSAIVEKCYEDIVLIDDNNEIILPSYDSAMIEPVSMSLSLRDDFTIHFCVAIGESYITDGHIQIVVGNAEPMLQKISDAQTDENGNYIFSVDVAAAQMMDVISLQLVMDNQINEIATYSIHEYAMNILQDETMSEYYALVKEMLNYGAAAQLYFDYNTENLANDGITDVAATDVPEAAEELVVTDKIRGLGFYGASLVYRDRIAVRYYFTGDVTGKTFTANGNTYTPVAKDGMYYVEIADILPQDLDDQITLTVTDANGNTMTVTYGPMNYIVRMNTKGNENLKNLMKALYNYHLAAQNYENSMNEDPDATPDDMW